MLFRSPHLRFGEISPRQAWDAITGAIDAGEVPATDGESFLRQLLWRDFAWHRRFHLPHLDADEASNPFNWQWVAGSGDDAAPYFRIFNPESQATRFDPTAAYIRRWVPKFGTPAHPAPMVDLRESRAAALAAYDMTKNAG